MSRGEHAASLQPSGQRGQRVLGHPRVELRLGTPAGPHVVVRAHVLAPAIGLDLDERRSLASSRAPHRGKRRLVDGDDIVAVDDDAGHAVSGPTGRDVLGDLARGQGRVRRIEIVLADEEDGQAAKRGSHSDWLSWED